MPELHFVVFMNKRGGMDLRLLWHFIVVAEEGSISRAAALLNMTPSPLTRHMQALEESCSVRLFKRTSMGVELTDAGRVLLVHARDMKRRMEAVSTDVCNVGNGLAGRVHIGVHGSSLLRSIPDVVSRFSVDYPGIELSFVSEPKPQLLELLRGGRLLVVFDRYIAESADISVEIVHSECAVIALPATNPLGTKSCITVEDLRHETFIEVAEKSLGRLVALCERIGYLPNILHRTRDQMTALLLVREGSDLQFFRSR